MVNILSDYIPPFSPLPNIAPFTYKDGQTYLSTLEALRTYINTTVVDFVNTNFTDLSESFTNEVNALILEVNNAVQELVNGSVELNEDIINQIISNTNSTVRQFLDLTYADKSIQDTVESGRLSSENLLLTFAPKTLQDLIDTGRLSVANLHNEFGPKIHFSVLDFGAIGDGVNDDTVAIQAAIDAALADDEDRRKVVDFPTTTGHYHYSKLNIAAAGDAMITLQGDDGGSYLRCINTDDDYSITITGVNADPTDITGAGYIRFVTFKNLKIMGSSYWNSVNQQRSAGIKTRCSQFITFENVWIGNFYGTGWWMDANWDSYYENVNVLYNGHAISNADYAYSIKMTNTCNALTFNKMHTEQYSLALLMDSGCRLNDFVACKWEDGGAPIAADGTTLPVFNFVDHYENAFIGGSITVDRPNNKLIISATQNDQIETSTWNVRRHLTFAGTKFISSHNGGGGRWLKGSYVKFIGCPFNRTSGASSLSAFNMEGGCIIDDCQISLIDNNIYVFRMASGNNTITNTTVYGKTGASTGGMLTIDGAFDNNSVDNLTLIGQFDIMLGGALGGYLGASKYNLTSNPVKTVTGGQSPSVLFTDYVVVTYPTPISIITFNHGTRNKIITVRSTNGNCTIQNNGNIATKTGADTLLTANQIVQFINDGLIWRQL